MTTPITFGSLFSGAGGFDLGLERAGWQCKFQVEWDKHCQQVLQYHWANVPKWEDVQQVNGADLPPVEVIAWGSPCQDLSQAGKRKGIDGERSGMFFEGIRIINEMREATDGTYPVVSIWENVAGSITSGNGDDFETVLRQMADTGTDHIEWRMLDAQWFGIPQRRRRIFVCSLYGVAAINAGGQQILAVANRSQRHSAQVTADETTVAGTLEESIGTSSKPILIDRAAFNQGINAKYPPHIGADDVSPTLVSTGPHAVAQLVDQPMIVDGTRVNDVRVDASGIAPSLISRMGTGGNTVPMLMPSETMLIRRLTEIECERLMGWNDDHTRFRADGKETPSTQRYKMCGNGVAAPVATWIAERITPLLRTDNE